MQRAYFSALALLGSHDDAMEVSQSAFIKAYYHFNKFDRSRNFFTWYYKILKNLCLNFIRDNSKRKYKSTDDFDKSEIFIDNIEENFEKKELQEKVQKILMKLDFEDREIIFMKDFQNMKYKTIAEVLEIRVGTVMSRLYYARKKIAEKLRDEL